MKAEVANWRRAINAEAADGALATAKEALKAAFKCNEGKEFGDPNKLEKFMPV